VSRRSPRLKPVGVEDDMAAAKFDIKEIERRMRVAQVKLKEELGGLRTGRASAHLLDPVKVDAYGQKMPIAQVGTINIPEPRLITIQVWDRAMVIPVDKAIREANLGLNPQVDGQIVRLRIPELTGERRTEIVKLAHKYTEHARVAVRNVRREGMELLKKHEKEHAMSEDESRKTQTKVQELTDKVIKEIDQVLAQKEAEIKQV
jgi:ribosome recycling factor